jgi:hypothetical protein
MNTIIYVSTTYLLKHDSPRRTIVRRGESSEHGVMKTKHSTATAGLSTECIEFKRNERLYCKLQPTTNPENDEKFQLITNHRTEQRWNNQPLLHN